MKILSAQQIREADTYTIENEPIASIDLMERAAHCFTVWFKNKFAPNQGVTIFCGPGNNGGDGLAIARLLAGDDYQVSVWKLQIGQPSADFLENERRLQHVTNVIQQTLSEGDAFPDLAPDTIVIDAIFGSGLNRGLEDWVVDLVAYLNDLEGIRVSVDIPSGLPADGIANGLVFKALHTCTFHSPKLSFFFAEHGDYIGDWHVCDIKLHEEFIQNTNTLYNILTKDQIRLKPRPLHSHKGTYGHSLLIAGSYGKIGAAILSGRACLRTGAGLVTIYSPKCGYNPIQSSFPEAMVLTDNHPDFITEIPSLEPYKAIAMGPGIGQEPKTLDALLYLIQTATAPLVLDADALNLLSHHQQWVGKLPANSILTPHPKEFERLFGGSKNSLERLQIAIRQCKKHNIIIALKGAYTAIISPDGQIWFNTTGNPGMATGGSGDVLTGIITSLLSQNYEPLDAAKTAVYLHGLAGDLAAQKLGMEALIAGDIIDHLGAAFLTF